MSSAPSRAVALTLHLGAFGWTELEQQARREEASLDELVGHAASHFQRRLSSLRVARRVPAFGATSEGTPRDVRLDLPHATWRALEREAARQGVSLERLLAHAALFYLVGCARQPSR